jgi:hypothetical protein
VRQRLLQGVVATARTAAGLGGAAQDTISSATAATSAHACAQTTELGCCDKMAASGVRSEPRHGTAPGDVWHGHVPDASVKRSVSKVTARKNLIRMRMRCMLGECASGAVAVAARHQRSAASAVDVVAKQVNATLCRTSRPRERVARYEQHAR